MVRALLDMKAALDEVLQQAFQRSETFGHALKDAFEHFINQRANRWGFRVCCEGIRSEPDPDMLGLTLCFGSPYVCGHCSAQKDIVKLGTSSEHR